MDGFGCVLFFFFCIFFFGSLVLPRDSLIASFLCVENRRSEPGYGNVGMIMETVMVGVYTRLGYRETAGGCAQAPTDTE